MGQTSNKTLNRATSYLESQGFNYDLTEEWYGRKTDYFRSAKCRYMVCVVNTPKCLESSNFVIIDAKQDCLAHDETLQISSNVIFNGRINLAHDIETIFKILKIED